jgi:hypothetical protein
MKKMIGAIALCSTLLLSSCLGSFQAFNNLKEWNSGVSESKFVNNLVFWGLVIIPVYEVFLVGDAIIFNVIEFWSGSNPIAMKPGESETQTVMRDGNTYEMVATTNRIRIKVIDGPEFGEKLELFYKPDDKSWNAIRPDGEIIRLSSFRDGFYLVYLPDGEEIQLDATQTREQGLASLKQQADTYYLRTMLAEAK